MDLLGCEQLCDHDLQCKGIYRSTRECFTVRELEVDTKTSLKGQSYRKVAPLLGAAPSPVMRLEVSLPVTVGV